MVVLVIYQEAYFLSTASSISDGFILSHPLFHFVLVNSSTCQPSRVKCWTFSYESEKSCHSKLTFMTLTSLALNFNLQPAEVTSHKYFTSLGKKKTKNNKTGPWLFSGVTFIRHMNLDKPLKLSVSSSVKWPPWFYFAGYLRVATFKPCKLDSSS